MMPNMNSPDPAGTAIVRANIATTAPRRIDGLRLIGLFKIGKAALLLLTTYGAYRLLDPAIVDQLHEWIYSLTDTVERRLLQRGLDWFDSLEHSRISGFVLVTGIYTAVLLTEGIGLWLRQVWAEWLTVIASSSLIPFELLELFSGRHGNKLAILAAFIVNVLIVSYLAWQLRRTHRARQAAAGGA